MRSFEEEIRTVAGLHDGLRELVFDEAISSPIVTQHEAMHGRIFRETPDGQIHAAFCEALERVSVDETRMDAIAKSVVYLFAVCRLPHEAFATYLSIKTFPADAEPELLDQLDQEYKGYYKTIAEIVDMELRCSFMQFLFAWNMAVAVFSSPLIERLSTLETTTPLSLSLEENPHARFVALLDQLRQVDFQQLREFISSVAEEECASQSFDVWDIYSENAWVAIVSSGEENQRMAMRLEQAISDAFRFWFLTIVPFPFLHGERLEIAFEGFSSAIKDKLGLVRAPWSSLAIDKASAREDEHVEAEAAQRSGSRILNTSVVSLAELDGSILLSDELFESSTSFAVYSSCPPDRNLNIWAVSFWAGDIEDREDQPVLIANFSRNDVMAFLERWLVHGMHGKYVPPLRAIVLAIQNPAELASILMETDLLLYKHEQFFSKLVWYWWGRFYDIYRLHSASKQMLFCGSMDLPGIRDHYDPNRDRTDWRYNGLKLMCLHVGEELGAGLYMRAFPTHTAASIARFQRALIGKGMLREMPYDMLSSFAPLVREGLFAAQSLWSEF